MPPDYRDAAERHWKDAEYLLADNRSANADHLFGLSAIGMLLSDIVIVHGLQMPFWKTIGKVPWRQEKF